MNQDIKIKTNGLGFKYRVSGILIKDNKVLTVQIDDNGFYCLPGGHVEIMESSKEAIHREFKEETKIDVNVEKPLYMAENFFDGKLGKYHELGVYYLLSSKENLDIKDYTLIEQDKNGDVKLEFKWMDINNLENFKPDFLKEELKKIDFKQIRDDNKVKHIIINK